MRFAVDRSRWRCGDLSERSHGIGETKLLNEHGYRCCLGFVGHQLGCPDDKMEAHGEPAQCNYFRKVIGRRTEDGWINTRLTDAAMEINDSEELSRADREVALKALFKKHGHEIVFRGKYTD